MIENHVTGLAKDRRPLMLRHSYDVSLILIYIHITYRMYVLPEQPTATMATATRIRVRALESTAESYAMSPRSGLAREVRLTFMRTPRFSVQSCLEICNETKEYERCYYIQMNKPRICLIYCLIITDWFSDNTYYRII